MKPTVLFVSALVSMAVVSCAPPWPSLNRDELPRDDVHPDAVAIILDEQALIEFRPSPKSGVEAYETRLGRVLVRKNAGRSHAVLRVPFDRQFTSVVDAAVRVTLPDGSMRELGLDDGVDSIAFPRWMLYSDSRVLTIDPSPVPLGSVIDTRYTLRRSEPRIFGFRHAFGEPVPVVRSRFAVVHPEGWTVRHGIWRGNDELTSDPTVERSDGSVRLEWARNGLAPVRDERLGVPAWALWETVEVQLASWVEGGEVTRGFQGPRDVSAWYHELSRETATLTPELRRLTTELVAAAPTPRDTARALYEWVQEQVLYCAIEVGYGGWRPSPASDVHQRGYGDCKDKANLLRAMLAASGIESRIASIYSHTGLPRAFRLPVVGGNFNHAVLLVELPDGPVLIDPTSRTTPFGNLPVGDQGAYYLPASADGSDLVEAPRSAARDNAEHTVAWLTANDSRGASGTFEQRSSGAFGDQLENALLESGAAGEHKVVAEHLDFSKVTTPAPAVRMRRGDASASVVTSGELRLDDLFKEAGDTRLLRPSDFLTQWKPNVHAERRDGPVVLRFPWNATMEIHVTYPHTWCIDSLPSPVELRQPFGSYKMTWSAGEGSIVLRRELTIDTTLIPLAQVPALEEFIQAIHRSEAQPATLQTGPAG